MLNHESIVIENYWVQKVYFLQNVIMYKLIYTFYFQKLSF